MAPDLDFAALSAGVTTVSELPKRTRVAPANPFTKFIQESLDSGEGKQFPPVSTEVPEGETRSQLDVLATKISSASQMLDREYEARGGVKTTIRKDAKNGVVAFQSEWRNPELAASTANGETVTTEAVAEAPTEEATEDSSAGGRRRRGNA